MKFIKAVKELASDHWEVSGDEIRMPAFWRDVAGELVASFYLMSIQCTLPLTWGKNPPALQNNLGIGGAIFVLIETFGQFGGAQMNPAVSIAFLIDGRITIFRTLVYIPAQLLGVSAGAGFIYYLTPDQFREKLSATNVHPDMSPVQGFLAEVWLTMFLLMVVYGSMNEARRPVFMNSLVIGFWVFVASCAGGEFCGASMNPARSFGPAIILNTWTNHWVYWAGPILGALMGTALFSLFFNKIGAKSVAKKLTRNVRKGQIGLMQTSSVNLACKDFADSLAMLARLPMAAPAGKNSKSRKASIKRNATINKKDSEDDLSTVENPSGQVSSLDTTMDTETTHI